jgi:Mg2+ and Co2+ transporter CorA
VAAHWIDLVDPSRDEILQATSRSELPSGIVDRIASPADADRVPMPLLEAHGNCVVAVLAYPMSAPGTERARYLELDIVARTETFVTIRKTSASGALAPVDGVAARADAHGSAGVLFHAAVDDATDAFLALVDDLYEAIDDLEQDIELLSGADIRRRIAFVRDELLHARRVSTMTRAIARRILDGRVDVQSSGLFPTRVESRFVDTYETLVRVTEELDVARDLLGGVRDYYQARIAEQQNEVAKTLTVIASLVLVPSLVVGFFGQNFAGEFHAFYWSLSVSLGLIVASTVVQLVLFRRRRWV